MEFSYLELLQQREKLLKDLPVLEKSMLDTLSNDLINFLKNNKFNIKELVDGYSIDTTQYIVKIQVIYDKVIFTTRGLNSKKSDIVTDLESNLVKNEVVDAIVKEKKRRIQEPKSSQFSTKKIIWYPNQMTIDEFFKNNLSFLF
jgi:hypothetical protein